MTLKTALTLGHAFECLRPTERATQSILHGSKVVTKWRKKREKCKSMWNPISCRNNWRPIRSSSGHVGPVGYICSLGVEVSSTSSPEVLYKHEFHRLHFLLWSYEFRSWMCNSCDSEFRTLIIIFFLFQKLFEKNINWRKKMHNCIYICVCARACFFLDFCFENEVAYIE